MKAETIEQYYILKWIEAHFAPGVLEIKLIDRHTVKVRDIDKKIARITCTGKDDITFTDDTTF